MLGTEQEKGKAVLQEASEYLKTSYLSNQFSGLCRRKHNN